MLDREAKQRTPPPPAPSPGGLKLRARVKGRKPSPLSVEVERSLREDDILTLNETEIGVKTPALQRIRDTHHHVARLLSEGLSNVEVSAISGMSPSRISVLRNDPAFQDLLEFYSTVQKEHWGNVQERLAMVSLEATAELHERLVEDPKSVKTTELVEIAKMGLDRTGHGPTSKIDARVAHFDGRELEAMKQSLKEAERGNVKTITLTPDSGAEGSQANPERPVAGEEGPESGSAPRLGLREKGS